MTALIWVPVFAATIIFSYFFWCYLSHTLIVIVEDTAAGNAEVVWSDEPYYEWTWQGAYVAWIAGVWVVPAIFVGRWVSGFASDAWRLPVLTLIAFAVFWLTFPISLLSTMSAESRWTILHGGLFVRLAKSIDHLFIFYLASLLLVAACVPLATWVAASGSFIALILAALAFGYAFVLYARLLGRLACIVRLTKIRRRKRKKRIAKSGAVVVDAWEIPDQDEQDNGGPGFVQPEDLPPLQTPYEGDVVGYNVRFEDVSRAPQPTPSSVESSCAMPEPELARAPVIDEEARQRIAAIKPDQLELDRARSRRQKLPKRPWTEGVWLFPFMPRCAIHWVVTSVGLLFFGLLIRVLIDMFPSR